MKEILAGTEVDADTIDKAEENLAEVRGKEDVEISLMNVLLLNSQSQAARRSKTNAKR